MKSSYISPSRNHASRSLVFLVGCSIGLAMNLAMISPALAKVAEPTAASMTGWLSGQAPTAQDPTNQPADPIVQDASATAEGGESNSENAQETEAVGDTPVAANQDQADQEQPAKEPATWRELDRFIDEKFDPIASGWEGLILTKIVIFTHEIPIVLILLVLSATFFTLVFGFVNIRLFPLALRVVSGKYSDVEKVNPSKSDPADQGAAEGQGEVSHFQALATAVSGTVGLGNIAGVAVAIATGGPGATFWMIICGLLGMSTKFVECTLGVKFREVDPSGVVHGGPMYYLKHGFKGLGMAPLGQALGFLFAGLCVLASFGGGNMFQANQAAKQIQTLIGVGQESSFFGALIGLIMAVVVAFVIIGGIKRIASVTEKLVPLMALIYVAAALVIIGMNFSRVPGAIGLIFSEAFNPQAIGGGLIGVIIIGFRRAAFSNEAGAGSAAIAHSAVKTRYPASEGIVALLEPFIDTVVICTMTAVVIILFNDGNGQFQYGDVNKDDEVLVQQVERLGGVDLTSRAFDTALPGFSYVLTVAIIMFAFSTMISWSYYGLQSWKFLFGRSAKADLTYKVLFCLFIVIGSAASLGSVIKFSDAAILALVFPNMIGLLVLFPLVRRELNKYLKATNRVDSGEN